MTCPRCHQKLKPDSRFCTACGSPIDLPAKSEPLATVKVGGDRPLDVPGLTPGPTPAPARSSNIGKVLGILGVVVVILMVSVVAVVWRFNWAKPAPATPAAKEATDESLVGGSLPRTNSPLVQKILGTWRNRTGKLELKFQDSPTGIEGVILKVPETWPKERVKVGDSVFAKGKVVGDTIEGLYINLPQGTDCQNLETRYSKCVISFESDGVMKVTNSAWQYSYPECKWSLVTYDDTWNWYKQ
jgi:hypothetical protein